MPPTGTRNPKEVTNVLPASWDKRSGLAWGWALPQYHIAAYLGERVVNVDFKRRHSAVVRRADANWPFPRYRRRRRQGTTENNGYSFFKGVRIEAEHFSF
ncbi:hypothetical protein EVAR_96225_1 [Eumeta japonica]|uniref:Uncharacterized protein n=1 Tax=Eumeta variegata TaxID=151549 RepID=A0A4C1WMV1_EUMVA|nr:hypothetical protein EVAR_96225_1 [Eumeta japonica]